MEEILKKALDADENLLWSGKPEKFDTLDKTYKPIFMKKLMISLIIGLVLSAGYIVLALKMNAGIKWAVIVIVWGFCALSPINIFRDAKQLAQKTLYAISDRRFITVVGESAKTVAFDRLNKAGFCVDKDGHTNLICGPDASLSETANQREAAVIGAAMDPNGEFCERYVMYAVPDAEKIKSLISGKIKLA